jgi:copper(I)-binding protein
MRPASLAFAALLALAPAALAQGPRIEVRQAWIRLPPNGSNMAAAYVEAVNGGRVSDQLVRASCTCATQTMIHRMGTEHGVMRMREAPFGLPLPPGGELKLEPGGNHIMLMGLRRPLHLGQRVPITLHFAHAGRMTVEATVRQ